MSMNIDLTPQEVATLKQVTKTEDDAEAVTKALGSFGLARLRELKSISRKS